MINAGHLEFDKRQSNFRLEIPELVVDNGTKVAVVGASGSDKTTLLNLM